MNFGCCPADVFRKPVRCLRGNVRGRGTDLRLRLCGRGSFELYGGSIRDDHVIATADKYGMVLAFTGARLFHH